MSWLVISIGASIVLTVLLNLGLRAFPGAGRRVTSAVVEPERRLGDPTRTSNRRVRVWAPWKAMIVGSLLLTIVVNVALWLART